MLFQDIISNDLYYTVNRGILADISFPVIGTVGTQTLHIKKPFHITNVSTLSTMPCEDDCRTMQDCLNDGTYSAISCFLGTFDKAGVEHLLKVHKIKELARNVKNEKKWLNQCVQAPHKSCAPLQGLKHFKELIFDSSSDKVVMGNSVLSEDLAALTCQRWLNINIISPYVDMLNSYDTETRTFILNKLIGLKARDLEKLIKTSKKDICRYFTFIVNVGTKNGSQYVGTSSHEGCHWSVLYVDAVKNEFLYVDTLGWAPPKDLNDYVTPILDAFFCASSIPRKLTCCRYLAHKTNVDGLGRHKCLNTCYKNIPLQDCASVCGVVAVIIASLICLQPKMWASCFLSRNNTLPDSLSWLTCPSRHSSYLRRVLIDWIMHGQIDTSVLGFSHVHTGFTAPLPSKLPLANNFLPTKTSNIQAAVFNQSCSNPDRQDLNDKENELLTDKQSNEKLISDNLTSSMPVAVLTKKNKKSENCNGHDLPETSPSGIPMPVSTQEKKECAKPPTQAKSKVVQKAFKESK